ncbi:MAG: zinc ABC transporter substrate-binding protein [Gemmatimonadetes bacterium]|uniref:Zinc ABC transporter substrate-binding protein n=1 Tax=Candidatus Kutchimonas denitrificans TaxID=3056748 RepID=A0AAE4ZAY9_9BACT|nr:zinc ABC transporter substrate-binding protein [Gemmatimonadota bacterium]NIR75471.1 zinc ABC transporter substrate-binding protein [Candidatus Kutchimonas denitrificans]NIS01785.1 zinc ABC transporter substrate-binding protein [Gemmatimonadota bacterium]NIT67566.1 zinc ABC transporter substrate-binding protein [Gemmatimonadota bacterium]NIU53440.1 zinc ABC transporter solute-binding protein [Gemmatimonadota bacterium]
MKRKPGTGRCFTVASGTVLTLIATVLFLQSQALAQDRLRVVTTLPTYAAIARELTGDLAEVNAIARGDEDPHFVNPRPSFAAQVGRADLFIVTGLDLELWVPSIIDRARNPRVVEGAAGNVAVYSGIELLQVPEDVSRTGGDVHAFGNPHIHTDPVNGTTIARNILVGLKRVDPDNSATYEANFERFEDRVLRRTYGDEFVDLLGAETILQLARTYALWEFAIGQTYEGRPLSEYVGGWIGEAAPFRDRRMACYHKNWAYFSARFRVECALYIEPLPGIPPSPGHLNHVITTMQEEHIPVLFAANYFSQRQVERVASRTGARAVVVPEHVDGAEGVDTYFDLIDRWVTELAEAFVGLDRRREHRDE